MDIQLGCLTAHNIIFARGATRRIDQCSLHDNVETASEGSGSTVSSLGLGLGRRKKRQVRHPSESTDMRNYRNPSRQLERIEEVATESTETDSSHSASTPVPDRGAAGPRSILKAPGTPSSSPMKRRGVRFGPVTGRSVLLLRYKNKLMLIKGNFKQVEDWVKEIDSSNSYNRIHNVIYRPEAPDYARERVFPVGIPTVMRFDCGNYIPEGETPRHVARAFVHLVRRIQYGHDEAHDVKARGTVDVKSRRFYAGTRQAPPGMEEEPKPRGRGRGKRHPVVTDADGWIQKQPRPWRSSKLEVLKKERAVEGSEWRDITLDRVTHARDDGFKQTKNRSKTLLKRLLAILCVGTDQTIHEVLQFYDVELDNERLPFEVTGNIKLNELPDIVTKDKDFLRFMLRYWESAMGKEELDFIEQELLGPKKKHVRSLGF